MPRYSIQLAIIKSKYLADMVISIMLVNGYIRLKSSLLFFSGSRRIKHYTSYKDNGKSESHEADHASNYIKDTGIDTQIFGRSL